MVGIIIVDVVILSVMIIGAMVAVGWRKGGVQRYILGLVSVLFAGFTYPIWPLDWLAPATSTRSSAQLAGYTIDYVQFPGGDFYTDRLEVRNNSGKFAFIALSPDNGKCWVGWTAQTDIGVEFYCFPAGRMATLETKWLAEQMETCVSSSCDLSWKWFSRR
jgi:hypothetical protein